MGTGKTGFLLAGLALLTGCTGSSQDDYDPIPEVLPQAPAGLTGYSEGDVVFVDDRIGASACLAAIASRYQQPVGSIDVVENPNGNLIVVAVTPDRVRRVCVVGTNGLVEVAEAFKSTDTSTFVFSVDGDRVELRAVTAEGTLAQPVLILVPRRPR